MPIVLSSPTSVPFVKAQWRENLSHCRQVHIELGALTSGALAISFCQESWKLEVVPDNSH